MSGNYLRLLPVEPEYVPSIEAQQQARALLANFLNEGEICIKLTEEIEFVDPGCNLEHIVCPVCTALVAEEWWIGEMDRAYSASHFQDLSVIMPCCNAKSPLNDLDYEWAVGFARFVLEICSPSADLTEQQLKLVERVLGCAIRKVWARY